MLAWSKWSRSRSRRLKKKREGSMPRKRLKQDKSCNKRSFKKIRDAYRSKLRYQEWNRKNLNWYRNYKTLRYFKKQLTRIWRVHWMVRYPKSNYKPPNLAEASVQLRIMAAIKKEWDLVHLKDHLLTRNESK